MYAITANELKTKGINAIKTGLSQQPEIAISVRGKERFVVMDVKHYHYLRECELEAALLETQSDMASGKTITESADKHIQRIIKGIQRLCTS